MEVVSDRHFRFPVSPDAFWAAISATDRYRCWWPWLLTFDARGLEAGEVWHCAVRPPLRYTVRFAVHLERVVRPRVIEAHVDGDLAGSAGLLVTERGDGCDVWLTSGLRPTRLPWRLVASIAGPLARHGHHWVIDTGARQFATRALTG